VVGTKEAHPLARSLFCQSFHYLPFANGFGGTSIPFINRLCDRLLIDWVIPSDPHTTRFLAENKAALGSKSYPVPDIATFELLNDKSAFINLCQDLGIPTPLTEVLPDKQQLLARLQRGHLKLPLVVKPISMEGGNGVEVLRQKGYPYVRYAPHWAADPECHYRLPDVPRDEHAIWKGRFASIRHLESHLHRNGTRILKFYLHLSKQEQRRRFLQRIDDPDKNWKFSLADVAERRFWKDYMHAYEECLGATSTSKAPWHIVPADDKDSARLMVSRIIVEALEGLDLAYPKANGARRRELALIRRQLVK
jgi:hypothetical protein